jgi:hypothetical protein
LPLPLPGCGDDPPVEGAGVAGGAGEAVFEEASIPRSLAWLAEASDEELPGEAGDVGGDSSTGGEVTGVDSGAGDGSGVGVGAAAPPL